STATSTRGSGWPRSQKIYMAETIGALAPAETRWATAQGGRRAFGQRFRRFTRRRLALVGCVLVGLEVGLAIAAPLLAPLDPNAQDFRSVLQPPGGSHLLGTDDLGRDILSRLLHGSRLSLQVGIIAVALAMAV